MSRSRSRSRRQKTTRRHHQQRRRRIMAVGLGLLVAGLVAWRIVVSVQRTALVRAAEGQPPVVGTPLIGGMDMSFIEPTPVPRGPGPQPRLVLPRDHYSFGVVSIDGSPVERSFRVLNDGEADLHIAGIATSCGCTTAALSADRIPPGESAELVVRYDPGFHRQPGNVTRMVYLYSNDPRHPQAVITITANAR